jgi:hypothetical protein
MKNVKIKARKFSTDIVGKHVYNLIQNDKNLTLADKEYIVLLIASEKIAVNQQAEIDNLIKNDKSYKSTITKRATFLRDNGMDKELNKLKAQVKTGMDKLNKNLSLQGLGKGKDKDGNFKQKPTIGVKKDAHGGKKPKTQADKVNQELKKNTKAYNLDEMKEILMERITLDEAQAIFDYVAKRVMDEAA